MSETTEEEPSQPELETFVVTATRSFEMDLHPRRVEEIEARSGDETVESFIAEMIGEQEADRIEPTQKLLNLDVEVDGPSDD
jgi:hypothetical protein